LNTVFAPGRTELAGNHTDHQKGRILASAVDRGLTAKCAKNDRNAIRITSAGFDPFEVKLSQMSILPVEFGKSISLVRGVAAAFKDLGLDIGGFDAEISSTLPVGSGMSSSAAFSVLIGKVLNLLYNNNRIEPVVLARCAQSAENRFFGKPCGLMDQLTSAIGHCIYVDFLTNEVIPVENASFEQMGLTLCLTDTGGSHAGLDSSYARIPADMVRIANMFDKGVLGEVDPQEFRSKGWSSDDRPVRRAMHFFNENERVPLMRDALVNHDADTYIRLMNESGRSSEELLNNIVTSTTGDTKLQEGLDLSAKLLNGKGAWRVHGGGFAGCVQALMPTEFFEEYRLAVEEYFGEGSCREIKIL